MKDILITLMSHPEPTPRWAIDHSVAVARRLGAGISGSVCQIGLPQISNFLADRLVGAGEAIADENRKSRTNAEALVQALREQADSDLSAPPQVIECSHVIDPTQLADIARLFDLTIVPSYGHAETRSVAEALVFGSGRPVLLLPSEGHDRFFEKVVVAWDGSRGATRAVHDALPILERAGSVDVVAVSGDKAIPDSASLEGITAHLERHGVKASPNVEPATGRDAGSVLLDFADRAGAGLLVMGAYGRSRIREFILGGATQTILTTTRLPVLLSH